MEGDHYALIVFIVYVVGVLHAASAIMHMRTSQGAIAWALCLILFPYISIPLYWIFGPRKFLSYRELLANTERLHKSLVQTELRKIEPFRTTLPDGFQKDQQFLEKLAAWPFTDGNDLTLYTDGEKIFKSFFDTIRAATEYVLLSFYILRNDQIGTELKDLLKQKVKQNVKVYFLIDQIGSWALPQSYIDELQDAGVRVEVFRTTKRRGNRFKLNFRNHRKAILVDGRTAFVGGVNVGDEYLGRNAQYGGWRDTTVKIDGPAVQGVQQTFAADWYWATETLPELNWQPERSSHSNYQALPIATGPTDSYESCTLLFLSLIQAAERRIWIATPYFVPDTSIMDMLQLAALRGVDVRLLVPRKADYRIVQLVGLSYLEEAIQLGVKVYFYDEGFMHQKAMLVDDELSAIGTANLDNRSLRLNFELMLLSYDKEFAQVVERMFKADFEESTNVSMQDFEGQSLLWRFSARFLRLFSPIL